MHCDVWLSVTSSWASRVDFQKFAICVYVWPVRRNKIPPSIWKIIEFRPLHDTFQRWFQGWNSVATVKSFNQMLGSLQTDWVCSSFASYCLLAYTTLPCLSAWPGNHPAFTMIQLKAQFATNDNDQLKNNFILPQISFIPLSDFNLTKFKSTTFPVDAFPLWIIKRLCHGKLHQTHYKYINLESVKSLSESHWFTGSTTLTFWCKTCPSYVSLSEQLWIVWLHVAII